MLSCHGEVNHVWHTVRKETYECVPICGPDLEGFPPPFIRLLSLIEGLHGGAYVAHGLDILRIQREDAVANGETGVKIAQSVVSARE